MLFGGSFGGPLLRRQGGGDFPKFLKIGGFLDDPPCTPLDNSKAHRL